MSRKGMQLLISLLIACCAAAQEPTTAASRPGQVVSNAINWSNGVSYTYDGSGNIRKIGTDIFIYDVAGRLVQGDSNGVRRNYEYDGFGNRTKCFEGSVDCQAG